MLRAERAEIFLFVSPLVTFWGTLVANEANKNLSEKLLSEEGDLGAVPLQL